MNGFEIKKKEFLHTLLFEAGAALMDCQTFEFNIGYLLFQFGRLGVVGLDPDQVSLILDDKEKKTAGQLVKLLKKHLKVSAGIEEGLTVGLAARNRLIHRVFTENMEKLPDPQGRKALEAEIHALRRDVRKASKALQPFIESLVLALDSMDTKVLQENVKKTFS